MPHPGHVQLPWAAVSPYGTTAGATEAQHTASPTYSPAWAGQDTKPAAASLPVEPAAVVSGLTAADSLSHCPTTGVSHGSSTFALIDKPASPAATPLPPDMAAQHGSTAASLGGWGAPPSVQAHVEAAAAPALESHHASPRTSARHSAASSGRSSISGGRQRSEAAVLEAGAVGWAEGPAGAVPFAVTMPAEPVAASAWQLAATADVSSAEAGAEVSEADCGIEDRSPQHIYSCGQAAAPEAAAASPGWMALPDLTGLPPFAASSAEPAVADVPALAPGPASSGWEVVAERGDGTAGAAARSQRRRSSAAASSSSSSSKVISAQAASAFATEQRRPSSAAHSSVAHSRRPSTASLQDEPCNSVAWPASAAASSCTGWSAIVAQSPQQQQHLLPAGTGRPASAPHRVRLTPAPRAATQTPLQQEAGAGPDSWDGEWPQGKQGVEEHLLPAQARFESA